MNWSVAVSTPPLYVTYPGTLTPALGHVRDMCVTQQSSTREAEEQQRTLCHQETFASIWSRRCLQRLPAVGARVHMISARPGPAVLLLLLYLLNSQEEM